MNAHRLFAKPLLTLALALPLAALAQSSADVIAPTPNLLADGIPAIPKVLAQKVAPYGDLVATSFVAWDPQRGGMIVRARPRNTTQLGWIAKPGADVQPLTDFPDAVSGGSLQPGKGDFLLFEKAAGGNEVFRLYRMDLPSKSVTPLSPENERAGGVAWNRGGDRIVYATVSIDRFNAGTGAARNATTKIYIADPLKPDAARLIARGENVSWSAFRFSPDGKSLLFQEYKSANESHLWLMDVATGNRTRVTPAPKEGDAPVSYSAARFAPGGKTLFVLSDRDSEFKRLAEWDLATGKETPLTAHLPYDVTEYAISTAAKRIAFVTNEDGSSMLRFLDLATKQELPRPALVPGIIGGLRWAGAADGDEEGDAPELAFTMSSAKSAGAAYSYHLDTKKMTRWVSVASGGVSTAAFVDPTLAKWKSFDGMTISGFVYRPDPAKFPGKRPVIVNIHGGPEGQARPGFIGRNNYYINEMGVAVIFPNVRGSTGFGKSFLAADNGMKREDSVKDIGALFDWIATQPDLDPARVLVTGGSYGGYMTLAVAFHYSDRIAGGISTVGISNFNTFLANTESYRRDLRRAEYGDERLPDMKKFFDRISPINNADKMKKPMFIVQGKNDPRVPYTEAVQIVEQLKKQGTPVWFLMADDEGHGFAKRGNQDFLLYAQIQFMERTLLK